MQCHNFSCTLSYYRSLQLSWPRSLPLNSVPCYMNPAEISEKTTSTAFRTSVVPGFLRRMITAEQRSVPHARQKSEETYCFDSSLKSILINYSVLKYCSGLINLIKSLHWTAKRAWIYLHEFNIPHTSLGIFFSEENITLQQNGVSLLLSPAVEFLQPLNLQISPFLI